MRDTVLGCSAAEGLYGDEAVMLYPQLIMIRFRFMGGFGLGGLGGSGDFGSDRRHPEPGLRGLGY